MTIQHAGLLLFSQGKFGSGGDNLFVDAKGVIRRIMDNDLNGDGIFDLVLPNAHGYVEVRIRFGATEQDVLAAAWSEPARDRVLHLSAPADSQYMQYSVAFHAPGLVNSPTLTRVRIE